MVVSGSLTKMFLFHKDIFLSHKNILITESRLAFHTYLMPVYMYYGNVYFSGNTSSYGSYNENHAVDETRVDLPPTVSIVKLML